MGGGGGEFTDKLPLDEEGPTEPNLDIEDDLDLGVPEQELEIRLGDNTLIASLHFDSYGGVQIQTVADDSRSQMSQFFEAIGAPCSVRVGRQGAWPGREHGMISGDGEIPSEPVGVITVNFPRKEAYVSRNHCVFMIDGLVGSRQVINCSGEPTNGVVVEWVY